MPSELDVQVLATITRQVMEEAAFLFSEPLESPVPFDGPVIEASLDFSGPVQGTLKLRAPESLCREASANMLGCEPDDEEAAEGAGAALGELLNMVSGGVMKAWFGAGHTCTLGVPRVVTTPDAPRGAGPTVAAFLAGEGCRVEVEAITGG